MTEMVRNSAGSVYEQVTQTLLAQIEAGCVPWRKPWSGSAVAMPRRVTGEAYRGINVVMLWAAAMEKGYASASWMTYRQAQELGGQVRKGERSTLVIKFGSTQRKGDEAEGGDAQDGDASKRFYARTYRVFNTDQIEGLDAHWYGDPDPVREYDTEADPVLSDWFEALGVPITQSDEPAAYYLPGEDRIHIPRVGRFESAEAFWATLAHEEAHATKHKSRLDRRHEGNTREERYAREEVVADLASAMVCARLGLRVQYEQHAAYLEHWVTVMREDSRAIVRAASMAQAAADWMFAKAGEPAWKDAVVARVAA